MKTLNEIIESVRDGGRPEYEELRYAILALEALRTFDRMAFMKMAENEREGKKSVLGAQHYWEEHFYRGQRAGLKDPKTYVGWNNDPDNPEFQKSRSISLKIMQKVLEKQNVSHQAPQD